MYSTAALHKQSESLQSRIVESLYNSDTFWSEKFFHSITHTFYFQPIKKMAPHSDPEEAQQVPEVADELQQAESGVDAEAEDEATGKGNEADQAKNELQELDTDNIIGGTNEGRQTRGNKSDPMAA